MFLRSLSVRGFKSFAEKTSLDFAPGTSVIVGPNGSGKSNLVDAISWVLGEQGPRALRGGQMADVIFAGSPARPALGMAEVHLIIDNTAGLIPVPVTEIEISRTIFRSGDSEYRIGGEVCRLLDIQELLSETGIGRALHTVVGQGQLEDVLTARPEERRQYIEEAAGIAKHRRRKERAQRKLASIEQDVLRLQDVLSELRRQLKPLKQQAEVAKRHEKLTSEADDLAWRLAAARLHDLYADRDKRRSGWDEGLARRQEARARLEALDRDLAELGRRREVAAGALVAAEETFQSAEQTKAEAERALREAIREESDARTRVATAEAGSTRLLALQVEIAQAEASVRETEETLAERDRVLEQAEREFREAERARLDAEEDRRRAAEEAASRRAEADTLQRSVETAERERARLEETLAGVRGRIEAAREEREKLENDIERHDADETPLANRQATLERERQVLAAEVAELEEALVALRARFEVGRAQLESIAESPGARLLRDRPGRALGLLKDLVRSEPGLRRALAAALGPLADAVVYEDEAKAVADVRESEGAVIALAGPSPEDDGQRLMEPSLIAALDVDRSVQGLVGALLRDVYVAPNEHVAAQKHREHPEATFVTPGGVLIGPTIVRTDAAPDAGAEALRREMESTERDIDRTERALAPKRTRLDELDREIEQVTTSLDRTDALITAAAERMARLATDLASLQKEEELLAERLSGLDDAAAAWREALRSGPPRHHELPPLPPHPEAPLALRVEVETLRRDRSRLESTLARLRAERDALEDGEPASLLAALRSAEERRAQLEQSLRGAEEALSSAAADRAEKGAEDRRTAQAEAEANRAWREAAAALDALREEYEHEDRARGELERRIEEGERLLREGHQKDPAAAVAALDEDDTEPVLARKSDLVSRRLQLLGRVNLLAEGEFGALQERHDFLARELDDVRNARRDLLEVIRRVDDEVVTLFDAAFRDVSAEFESLFKVLFPGGEGRVFLTDPADLLGAGVEIEARPGRKRVKRISLLSGGERALTAIGFLFAIFRARPSPFYLLDEVEAALDDVNLHRFLQLIRDFAKTSQVLVVTHQKRTMEAADMLYGVSMNRDGSSTVVAQRLEEAPEAADEVVVVSEADTIHQ